MPINDSQIHYIRKRKFYTITDMNALLYSGAAGALSSLTAGVTNAAFVSSGLVVWDMAAGEFVGGLIHIPYDVDPKYELGFKIHYSGAHNSGTGSVEWIVLANVKTKGSVIALATTVLNTVIGVTNWQDAAGADSTTDSLLQTSNRGIMLASNHQLTRKSIEDMSMIAIKIENQANANMTEPTRFIGMSMDYVPMITVGVGSEIDRPLKSTGI